jgi:TrmH family RNA methyltransferase
VQKPGEITSKSNPRIKDYLKLKKRSHRYERKMYLGEGIQMLKEALASTPPIEALFLTVEGEKRTRDLAGPIAEKCRNIFSVSSEVMAVLTSTVTPQGIVAVLPFVHYVDTKSPAELKGPLVFLDKVRDPGNLGTMIRIADAAGMESVLISKGSADLYNPKTAGASWRPIREPGKVSGIMTGVRGRSSCWETRHGVFRQRMKPWWTAG